MIIFHLFTDYAILALTIQFNKVIVLGGDCSASVKQDDIDAMIDNFVMNLRQDRRYEGALFVIFIEANMSWITTHETASMLKHPRYGRTHIVSKDPSNKGRPGIWTGEISHNKIANFNTTVATEINCVQFYSKQSFVCRSLLFNLLSGHEEKEMYASHLEHIMKNDRIHFAINFISGPKDEYGALDPVHAQAYKNDLFQQLKFYRRESKPAKDPQFEKPRFVYGGKGSNKKDDKVMTLQIAMSEGMLQMQSNEEIIDLMSYVVKS